MNWYERLRAVFQRFYFFCQKRVTPGLIDSQYRYVDKLSSVVARDTVWLDVGCGHRLVPAWTRFDESQLCSRAKFIVGMDRDEASLKRHKNLHARVIADVDALPFRSGAFTLVTANMVVEHLSQPRQSLAEVAQILRPGGLFVFHTVNLRHYNAWISSLLPQWLKLRLVKFFENRKAEDVYPTHYRLNTRKAIHLEAAGSNFEIREIDLVNSSAETIMLGPVVLLELLVIRLLSHPRLAEFRSNVIAVLRRKQAPAVHKAPAAVKEREPVHLELKGQLAR